MQRSEFLTELQEGLSNHLSAAELGSPAQTVKLILAEGYDRESVANIKEAALNYAPMASRVLAGIIDHALSVIPLVFFGVLNVLPFMIIWPPFLLLYTVAPPSPSMIIGGVICTCYFVAYHSLFLFIFKGRTPGKLLLQMRVVNHNGSPLRVSQIFGRELIGRLLVTSVTFGISSIVSFFWCLFSAQNKTVHDAIANTSVISSSTQNAKE